MKKIAALIFTLVLPMVLAFSFAGCTNVQSGSSQATSSSTAAVSSSNSSSALTQSSNGAYKPPDIQVSEDGEYTDKDHVALYIHEYGTVPKNYITKSKARQAGWVITKGNLWDVLPGRSIGGGGFNNDDGLLPDAPGRKWFECDIDYNGGYRNEKRIVYSNDGLVFYTGDHYNTFQQLY